MSLHAAGLLAIVAVTATSGCGAHDTYVKADDAALGRVVIYRNGIAYFERRARTEGRTLAIAVPENKVNDFLKSLTVTDAKTGETLPVSFPTRKRSGRGTVAMTIQLPAAKTRDLVLSYITDAPAWKSTYRVVVNNKGKVQLQGWAIVDNTSGEDWRQVKVGVGSSSALSFRYDLRTVRRVYREMLRSRQRFAHAPPTGGAVHRTTVKNGRVVMNLDDAHIPRPAGHPEKEVAAAERVRSRGGLGRFLPFATSKAAKSADKDSEEVKKRKIRYDRARRQWARSQARGSQQVKSIAKRLAKSSQPVVIEGYARSGEAAPTARARDRANTLRNALIREGVAPARIKIAAKGVVRGHGAGVAVVLKKPAAGAKRAAVMSDEPVGESHFESKLPMTVAKGTSAMVSVVTKGTAGEIVYLFDPDTRRGNRRFAFKAVRFANPTDSTLDAGPMTVYGEKRFIGEGMTSAIPPKSNAIVPFAMDRQVRVERSREFDDRIAKLLEVKRGILTAKVNHVRRTRFVMNNRSGRSLKLFVRHTVGKGWKLAKHPKIFEKLGETHLFTMTLEPHEHRQLVLEETTPLQRSIDLRSARGISLMRRYIAENGKTGPFGRQLVGILAEYKRIGHLGEVVNHLRQRNVEYRTRMDELHGQIASLKMVRAGSTLLRHLQKKMREMSNAVQKTTIKVVNTEEQLMLSRIRFHDGVSELLLPAKRAASGDDNDNQTSPEKATKTTGV